MQFSFLRTPRPLAILALCALVCSSICGGTFGHGIGNASECIFIADALTTMDSLLQCLRSVPLDPATRTETLLQVRNLAEMYSFTEISRNSGPPFNISVDFFKEIEAIETKYSGVSNQTTTVAGDMFDFQFHEDLSRLFRRFGDSHLEYTAPIPYTELLVPFPLLVAASYASGDQFEFRVVEQSQFYNLSVLESASGRLLTDVNDMPTLVWIEQVLMPRLGTARDAGARLNIALTTLTVGGFRLGYDYPFDSSRSVFALCFADSVGGQKDCCTVPIAVLPMVSYANAGDFESAVRRRPLPALLKDKRLDDCPMSSDDASAGFAKNFRLSHNLPHRAVGFRSFHRPSALSASDDIQILRKSITSDVWCGVSGRFPDRLILRLSTFQPMADAVLLPNVTTRDIVTSYLQTVELCRVDAKARGIHRMVIDVRNNPGGFICLAVLSSSLLFRDKWGSLSSLSGIRNTMEVYDFKKSRFTDFLASKDALKRYRINPKDGVFSTNIHEWYDPTVVQNRAGASVAFTAKGYYPPQCAFPADSDLWSVQKQIFSSSVVHSFDRVVLLSDSQCGSACSLFTSHIRYRGAGLVLVKGGYPNRDLDSSIYAGGNILEWNDIAEWFDPFSAEAQKIGLPVSRFPTTSFVTFNFNEWYPAWSPLPREFSPLFPDSRDVSWNFAEDAAVYVRAALLTSVSSGSFALSSSYVSACLYLDNSTAFSHALPLGDPFPLKSFAEQGSEEEHSERPGEQEPGFPPVAWWILGVMATILFTATALALVRWWWKHRKSREPRWTELQVTDVDVDDH
eukprot:ANDGO_06898.mRNA.1 hypothetical protein